MKLQTVLTLEEALLKGLINDSGHQRLIDILNDATSETYRKTSLEMTDEELEKLNLYVSRNYESSILSIMRNFRFTDLTETYRIKPSYGKLRITSFDKTAKEVGAKIILGSMNLKMNRSYDSYVVAQHEELYGLEYLTFKLSDNLTVGSYDDALTG